MVPKYCECGSACGREEREVRGFATAAPLSPQGSGGLLASLGIPCHRWIVLTTIGNYPPSGGWMGGADKAGDVGNRGQNSRAYMVKGAVLLHEEDDMVDVGERHDGGRAGFRRCWMAGPVSRPWWGLLGPLQTSPGGGGGALMKRWWSDMVSGMRDAGSMPPAGVERRAGTGRGG